MSVQAYKWNDARRSGFRMERWSWSLRLWGLFAFVLALLFHWWLYLFFNNFELGKKMLTAPPKQTRQDRLKIDPTLLKEQQAVQDIPKHAAPTDKPQMKAD